MCALLRMNATTLFPTRCFRLQTMSEFDKNGFFPIHSAAYEGDFKTVKVLLDNGVDVDIVTKDTAFLARKSTAMHCASSQGRFNIVKLLIERKATIDKTDTYYCQTAFHHACRNGHL